MPAKAMKRVAEGLEFADLEGLGFDLDLTGFEPGELNALVSPTGGHTGEDEAPAARSCPFL